MSASVYTFLPWLRTGIGARLAQSPAGRGRAAVDLKLHIEADNAIRKTIDRKVELYGPGDILGVNTNAIIRTVPRRGARNFESNFFAAIDFYDEDFPWRYSPAAPVSDRVAPWLWLLVLEQTEFDLGPPIEAGLPVVRLHENVAQSAFPKTTQTWAWAHTHLNFKVADNDNSDLQAALRLVQTELSKNPNLGCSRLVCPRRLKQETKYTAFLIPAFEKGRLAGLGADVDSTDSLQSSWPSDQSLLANHYPIYYQWSFSTMAGGGFEELATRITPVTRAELLQLGVGKPLTMDIRSPGWGIRHADPKPTVVLPSVFRLPRVPNTPPEPEFPAPASQNDGRWTDSLAQLLNLSVQMQDADADLQQQKNPIYADASSIGDDPVVTPPLYGSWYLPPAKAERAKMPTDWFHQMNLHPALRVVGGVGAEVIRDNQEEYMERAWEQADELGETNNFIKNAQLSTNASMAIFSKHMSTALNSLSDPAPSNQQVRGLRLASMSHSARVIQSGAARAQAQSLASPDAMKMFRPNGALMSRIAANTPATPVASKLWFNNLQFPVFELLVVATPVFNVEQMTKTAAFNVNLPLHRLTIQGLHGGKVQSALDTHKNYFALPILTFFATRVSQNIAERLRPDIAIAKKVHARLPDVARTGAPTTDFRLLRVTPDFPEPMFDAVAQQSLDFVMPGVDKFPVDRCGLFESNRTFVEAFMVGLNYEMAREMLWREFPASLTATFFSQFWDKSDTPAAPNLAAPVSTKDIKPISDWAKPSTFGHPTHRVGAVIEPLFFVLRGDLLRKYPNTVVFMQRAKRVLNARVPDETVPIKMPVASARLEQDIFFLGFDISQAQAIGGGQDAGWYVGLQERPGDIHFGLDQETEVTSPTEPHWDNAGTQPGQCVDLENGRPLFAELGNSAAVAMLLYQKPFMVLIHATKMLG